MSAPTWPPAQQMRAWARQLRRGAPAAIDAIPLAKTYGLRFYGVDHQELRKNLRERTQFIPRPAEYDMAPGAGVLDGPRVYLSVSAPAVQKNLVGALALGECLLRHKTRLDPLVWRRVGAGADELDIDEVGKIIAFTSELLLGDRPRPAADFGETITLAATYRVPTEFYRLASERN